MCSTQREEQRATADRRESIRPPRALYNTSACEHPRSSFAIVRPAVAKPRRRGHSAGMRSPRRARGRGGLERVRAAVPAERCPPRATTPP